MDGMMRRAAAWGCVLSASFAFASCVTTDFSAHWNRAVTRGAPESGIAGAWAGTWNSVGTQSSGPIRCVVTPPSGGAGNWDFHFSFTSEGQQGSYHVVCPVQQEGGVYRFRGDGAVEGHGVYRHEGRISGNSFRVNYESLNDHGTFRLSRPTGAAAQPVREVRNPALPPNSSITRRKTYRY